MNITSVKRVHQSDWRTEGVRFLRARDIVSEWKNEKPQDYLYISNDIYNKYSELSGKVSKGDLLVTGVGTIGIPYLIRNLTPIYFKDGNIIWLKNNNKLDGDFLYYSFCNSTIQKYIHTSAGSGTVGTYTIETAKTTPLYTPSNPEQQLIGSFFNQIDNLVTLHQRKSKIGGINRMITNESNETIFADYYKRWIAVYKEGAVRKVTLNKYKMSLSWVQKLIPDIKMSDLNRTTYQDLLNKYAISHERQTTMDFHHQLKGAIIDAVDDGLIPHDPTRKAIIKGKEPRVKKVKYLNQFQLHTLLSSLSLNKGINYDFLILLIAKTGLRFSEALAITPEDFDFSQQLLIVNKTWDYKDNTGFAQTKNKSSIRKIQIDWKTVSQFSELVKDLPKKDPIFVKQRVYNSTINDILARHCKKCNIPIISIHGLRHTHASLLLFTGVSIASVARRLGHASMTTTQKTYLHIIQELENKDIDLVMRSLANLN
jgi:integrase